MADERSMDFADDVAFEAPDDFPLAEAFLGAFEDVGAGGAVVPHADEDDVDGQVSGTVPATAEAVPVGLPGRRRQGRRSGEGGECRFRADSFRVVPGGCQQLAGDFGSDPKISRRSGAWTLSGSARCPSIWRISTVSTSYRELKSD